MFGDASGVGLASGPRKLIAPLVPFPELSRSGSDRARMASDAPQLQTIRVLSDGRPGHENQSLGLAEALARRTGAVIETVRITGAGYLARYQRAMERAQDGPWPQLLIGAGHAVHLPLSFAARRFGARSVLIMEPTWPKAWFDLCLVPEHDLPAGPLADNVIPTRGALNRIPETRPPKQPRGVVLLGGPSRHHGWDGAALVPAIAEIVRARSEFTWTIANSRRTPPGFLEELNRADIRAELMAHTRTPPGWVPEQLLAATEVWVTEDSISMMYEAVTAGARTGLLPAPPLRANSRVLRAVEGLLRDGLATRFADWAKAGRRLPPPRPFHETARCAELVLARFFRLPGASKNPEAVP